MLQLPRSRQRADKGQSPEELAASRDVRVTRRAASVTNLAKWTYEKHHKTGKLIRVYRTRVHYERAEVRSAPESAARRNGPVTRETDSVPLPSSDPPVKSVPLSGSDPRSE